MAETNKRRTRKAKRGGRKSMLRKSRRVSSFFGFGNRRQESESNKTTAVVAALAVVPFNEGINMHDNATGPYEGGRLRAKKQKQKRL
jgi:hypothetical protein